MDLKEFVKTKKTQKFLHTSRNQIYTKSQVIEEIQNVIEKWTAFDEAEQYIKDKIQDKLFEFEPYTKEFQEKVKKLMKKWGLESK